MAVAAIAVIASMVVWRVNARHPQEPPPRVVWTSVLVPAGRPVPFSFLLVGNGGRIYFGEYASGLTRILDSAGRVFSEKVIIPANRTMSREPFVGGDGKVYVPLQDSNGNDRIGELLSDGSIVHERKIWSAPVGTGVAADKMGCFYFVGNPPALSHCFSIAKYDNVGRMLWTQTPRVSGHGLAGPVACSRMALDRTGEAYVIGVVVYSGISGFIAKVDSTGRERWVVPVAFSNGVEPCSVAADGNRGAYVAGGVDSEQPDDSTSGSLWTRIVRAFSNFGINRRLRASGPQDSFVAKFDGSGNQEWFHQESTPEEDAARVIAVDGKGCVFIAGPKRTGTGSDWDGLFAAKYDPDGRLLWRTRVDMPPGVEVQGISVDNKGGIYVCGTFGSPERCFLVKMQERK